MAGRFLFNSVAAVLKMLNTRKRELSGAGPCLDLPGAPEIDTLLARMPRLMWVAAHPDDESFAGALLARASLYHHCPLHFLVLTRGEGGECCLPGQEGEDLPTQRSRELLEVARLYNATLEHHSFWNAPLPVDSFPPRHEIGRRWIEQADPTRIIATAIRSFRPDILLTLAPEVGGTGHPEHQLVARFATAAIRLAALPDADLAPPDAGAPQPPHRVSRCYYLVNRYWFMRRFGGGYDPRPWTQAFDVRLPCIGTMTCAEVMAEHTRPHRSQDNDMAAMRRVAALIHHIYLHETDPFGPQPEPLEPAAHGGMG